MQSTNDSSNMMSVRQMKEYLTDVMGYSESDFDNYSGRELVEVIKEQGEWDEAVAYTH